MATNFKNLDYLQIKESLKQHLKTLKEFQDFDFEASGIQQILSLLAYNTSYNAFYLNMVGAEMFLDSAQLRSSVTSRAKAVGYIPSSAKCARAKIRIEVDTSKGPLEPNPPFVRLNQSDEFISYLDGKSYVFTPDRSYIIEPDASGKYVEDVVVVEGKRLKVQFVVDRSSPTKQRFEIPNKNVDLSTISVKVKESTSSSSVRVFSPASNINVLNQESLVYFAQENQNELYEVYFGEAILGVQPQTGNIVIIEYVVTSGTTANGLKTFTRAEKATGYNGVKITIIDPANGGKERETNDSIKFLAPLLYEAQDRAVTKNDYEAIIRKDNPNVEFVRVWGGEETVPPDFGKVYAAIKPKTGTRLSADQKATITNRLLRERNVIAVEVKVVDPDYIYMATTSLVKFKGKTTTLKATDIKKAVYDEILGFKNKVLNGFDADFSFSKLVATIDGVDRSITGNLTRIELKKRIYPAFNNPSRFELKFHNKLDRGDSANGESAITSTGYVYRGVTTYIGDNGQGSLYLYRIVDSKKVVIQQGIGTVDYEAGTVVIESLDVQDIIGQDFIEVIAKPLNQDIYTPRESILLLDPGDIRVYVDAVDMLNETA